MIGGISQYFPTVYVEDVFSIDYQNLYDSGIRGVIFDIDNTLVPHGNDSTPQVDNLFKTIHSIGLKTLLLSNNSEERIMRFNKKIDTLYICDAGKPSVSAFYNALEKLKMKRMEVVVIGDQVFSDICGANHCGIKSILVKYIGFHDKGWKGYKRILESIILWLFRLKSRKNNDINY